MVRPLVFIDVDGVLNRLVSNREAKRRHYLSISVAVIQGWPPFRLHCDLGDANRLTSLIDVADLAWGTTWEDDADQLLAARLHLPRGLPVARHLPGDAGKAPGVVRLAAGRPFVWFDDDVRLRSDLEALTETRELTQPWHLISVEPTHGLSDEHVSEAREWLMQHAR